MHRSAVVRSTGLALLDSSAMKAGEIRERFLSFFERNGHLRVPSASLVPSVYDPSVLLTTAGMQPFKPYFRGEEEPPVARLTSCQKSFRTTDIEDVGLTAGTSPSSRCSATSRSATTSRRRRSEFALELSTTRSTASGSAFEDIWITVFGGDEELGLGPDEEAIECWRAVGVPDERIVQLGREDNFWQSGPTGPCGPCSELYLDRGPDFGPDDDRPGDDTERFLEFWNLVFMQYELQRGRLAARAAHEEHRHRHGARADGGDPPGASRRSSRPTCSRPLVELGEELSGRKYGQDDFATTRALRVISPTTAARATVPARRRRRPVQRGPRLHPAPHHAPRDPAGSRARHRRALPPEALRARRATSWATPTPSMQTRVAHDRALGARRGGGLQPHARAGRAAARRAGRAREGATRRPGSPPRTPSSSTTPTASPTR